MTQKLELPQFRDAVGEAAELLAGVQRLLPNHVGQPLLDYLRRLQDDPVGLELLRNAIQG